MNARKVVTFFMIAFLVTTTFPPLSKGAEEQQSIENKIEPYLLDKIVKLEANKTTRIISLIIILAEKQAIPDMKTVKNNTATLLIKRHSARDMYIASILPFLIMKVNSTELRAIAAYEFVKLLGDGERQYEPALDVSIQTVHASYVQRTLNYNGSGKVIAILDSGINESHPSLAGKVIDHVDYTNTGFGDASPIGHGTHCAGIAAGTGAGSPVGSFYPGVAPGASLLNVKIGTTLFFADNVVKGINWAVEHNADVISMSAGIVNYNCNCPLCPVCIAVKIAVERGVTVVISAGNYGPLAGSMGCPGCCEEAITVGAIDDFNTPSINDDRLCVNSSRGPTYLNEIKPDVVAPSGDPFLPGNIMSPDATTGGYSNFGGTSAAAPHVAGVAALILQAHPNWTPAMVKCAIKATANLNDLLVWSNSTRNPENDRGKGIVDAARAVSFPVTEIPPDQADSKYENAWGNANAIAYLNGVFRIWAAGTAPGGNARAEARLNKTFTPSHDMSNATFFFGFHDVGSMEADLGYAHFYAILKLWQGNTILASTEKLIHDVAGCWACTANCYHTIQFTYQGTLLAGQQYKLEYGFYTFAHVAWSNFYDAPKNITALHLTAIDTVGVGNPSFEERVGSVYESWYWVNNRAGRRELRGDCTPQGGDGVTDIYDLVFVGQHLDSQPGDPNWNPRADLNGDNIVDLFDLVIVGTDLDKTANRKDGSYSWYTYGGGDYTLAQWLCDQDVNVMKGKQVAFTFWFLLLSDGLGNCSRAEIRYITSAGNDQTINGTWVYPTQIAWYSASITTALPADTIAIQIIIHGKPNFKAWIDTASITVT